MNSGKQIKIENWGAIRPKLTGHREKVWHALAQFGPCTTRHLAASMGWDILTVRPRVTELVQLGFAGCTGKAGHDGTYAAVPLATAQQRFEAAQRAAAEQTLMKV
jgi:hypothetical protein